MRDRRVAENRGPDEGGLGGTGSVGSNKLSCSDDAGSPETVLEHDTLDARALDETALFGEARIS